MLHLQVMVINQLICFSFLLFQIVRCDIPFEVIGNYISGSSHATQNIDSILYNLTQKASRQNFYNCSAGNVPDKIYGLFHCREDLNQQDCSECIQHLLPPLWRTNPYPDEVILWGEKCMLQYANQSSFPLNDKTPFTWKWSISPPISTDQNRLAQVLSTLMTQLTAEARTSTSGSHFAVGDTNLTSSEKLYALVQCSPFMSESDCGKCLQMALDKTDKCCNARTNAMVFLPSCQVRYDMERFYNLPAAHEHRIQAWKIVLIVIFPIVGIRVLVLVGICLSLHQKKAKGSQKADMDEIKIVESLQFNLSTIKAATNSFSADNKLGKGGFGEVYKGKLGSGQEIAVKRLSRNSGQGISEFKNEVLLVAKLQHRNLVRLLGFCIAAKEKILIYELLCNSSLDRFLYDPVKRASLDWETRFKIISGIARGLLYLHEDSRLKIIHRDMKASNILLDEMMNPKISDFGIAKLVELDHTEGDTSRIVGTYGYMAPEYAMAGQFSVKSDVYSFGVIVLEIVSGQRTNILHQQHEEGLLHRAWRTWNQGGASELVDTLLGDDFSSEEVRTAVHIGLLCVQEDANMRPKMASIVAALNGQSITLPLPMQPHFFTVVAADDETSTNYYSLVVEDGAQTSEIGECVSMASLNVHQFSHQRSALDSAEIGHSDVSHL